MNIAGYILAGGDNRRMDGRKKIYLHRDGKTFGQWICEAFSGLSGIYLSVAKLPEDSVSGVRNEYGLQLPEIRDCYGHIGPMGGIASGLSRCREDALFVAACDMPFISRDAVRRMVEAYSRKPVLTIASSKDRLHPLFGIYPRTILPVLERQIQNQDYRMMNLLEQVEYETVDFGKDSPELRNINTREQYKQMEDHDGCESTAAPMPLQMPFIFAISGYKNSGKTTLITRLIPVLVSRGYRVAVIKHDGHDFESDVPGTDSYRHQKAGAYGTAVFSGKRIMLTKEIQGVDETRLFAAFPEADIIVIEGLKNSSYPRYFCNYPEEEPISPEKLADQIIKAMREV